MVSGYSVCDMSIRCHGNVYTEETINRLNYIQFPIPQNLQSSNPPSILSLYLPYPQNPRYHQHYFPQSSFPRSQLLRFKLHIGNKPPILQIPLPNLLLDLPLLLTQFPDHQSPSTPRPTRIRSRYRVN